MFGVYFLYNAWKRQTATSPWWTHFQVVDGHFPVVQCIFCNKVVRRGKAGCLSSETSNSGNATHMRSKHRNQANQVVHFHFKWMKLTLTLQLLGWIWTRLTYNCAYLRSIKESLTFEYDIWWYSVSRRRCCLVLGGIGSVWNGTGWYMIILGQYCLALGGAGSVWGGTGWIIMLLGQYEAELVDTL